MAEMLKDLIASHVYMVVVVDPVVNEDQLVLGQ